MTYYLIRWREDETSEWLPWSFFHKTQDEAVRLVMELTRSNSHHYDVLKCGSIIGACYKEEKVMAPDMVREGRYDEGAD